MDKNFRNKPRKDINSSIDAKQQNSSKTYGIRERSNAQERESKRLKVSSDSHVLMDIGTEQVHAEGRVDKSPPVSLPQYECSVLSQRPEASGSSSVDQFDRPLYSPVHPYDFHRFDRGLESVPFADQSDFMLFSPYMYQPGSFTDDLWAFDPGQEGLLFDPPASSQFHLISYQRESLGTGAMSSHELESSGSHSVDAPADVQLPFSDESHYQESSSRTPQMKPESLPFDLVQPPPSELPSDTLADVDKPSLSSKEKSLKVEVPFVDEKPTGIESGLDLSLHLARQNANQLEGKRSSRKAADNRSTEVSSSREADRQATKYDSKDVSAWIRHGRMYLQEGELDEALRVCLRVTDDLDKDNVHALAIVGEIYRRKRQYKHALEAEVRRRKLLPGDPIVFVKCAEMCEKLAEECKDKCKEVEWWEQAVKYLKQSHELDLENAKTSGNYARVLKVCAVRCEEVAEQCKDKHKEMEWREQAVEYQERSIEVQPKDARALRKYAEMCEKLGDLYKRIDIPDKQRTQYKKSVEYFERSIQTDPNDTIALRKCAEMCEKLGNLYGERNMLDKQIAQYKKSVEYFERSIQLEPKNARTLESCARMLRKCAERCEEVAKQCKDKRKEVEWREQALEYRERSIEVQPENAIDLRKCTEKYKELGDLYGEINMPYRQIAQYEESVRCFEQSIDLEPKKNARTLGNCARMYEKMGDLIKNTSINRSCKYYKQAIKNRTKQIDILSTDAEAFGKLGEVYKKIGALLWETDRGKSCEYYEKARKELTEALTFGELGWIVGIRGEAHEALGEKERALQDYRRAIRLDPSLHEICEKVDKLEHEQHQITEASSSREADRQTTKHDS